MNITGWDLQPILQEMVESLDIQNVKIGVLQVKPLSPLIPGGWICRYENDIKTYRIHSIEFDMSENNFDNLINDILKETNLSDEKIRENIKNLKEYISKNY